MSIGNEWLRRRGSAGLMFQGFAGGGFESWGMRGASDTLTVTDSYVRLSLSIDGSDKRGALIWNSNQVLGSRVPRQATRV